MLGQGFQGRAGHRLVALGKGCVVMSGVWEGRGTGKQLAAVIKPTLLGGGARRQIYGELPNGSKKS